ncbi:hypothetical protein MMPV_006651 [Pyropia vietnamensis]
MGLPPVPLVVPARPVPLADHFTAPTPLTAVTAPYDAILRPRRGTAPPGLPDGCISPEAVRPAATAAAFSSGARVQWAVPGTIIKTVSVSSTPRAVLGRPGFPPPPAPDNGTAAAGRPLHAAGVLATFPAPPPGTPPPRAAVDPYAPAGSSLVVVCGSGLRVATPGGEVHDVPLPPAAAFPAGTGAPTGVPPPAGAHWGGVYPTARGGLLAELHDGGGRVALVGLAHPLEEAVPVGEDSDESDDNDGGGAPNGVDGGRRTGAAGPPPGERLVAVPTVLPLAVTVAAGGGFVRLWSVSVTGGGGGRVARRDVPVFDHDEVEESEEESDGPSSTMSSSGGEDDGRRGGGGVSGGGHSTITPAGGPPRPLVTPTRSLERSLYVTEGALRRRRLFAALVRRPRLALSPLTGAPIRGPVAAAFVAHGPTGEATAVVVAGGELLLWALSLGPPDGAAHSAAAVDPDAAPVLPAVTAAALTARVAGVAAAAGVVATRPGGTVDTLVLTRHGELQLWVGVVRVAGVALGGRAADGRVPVGLRDAVASRVTVLLAPEPPTMAPRGANGATAARTSLPSPAAAVAAVRADLRGTRPASPLAAALVVGVEARVASRAVPPSTGNTSNPPAGADAALALRRALLRRRAAVLDDAPRTGCVGSWDDGAGHAWVDWRAGRGVDGVDGGGGLWGETPWPAGDGNDGDGGGSAAGELPPMADWRLLAAVLLGVPSARDAAVVRRWPGGVAGGGVGIGRDDALLSDWAWLLASDTHVAATPTDAPGCDASAPDAAAIRRSLGWMMAAAATAASADADADADVDVDADAVTALAVDALAVTHALYEEAKLTRAAEADLPVLGGLAAALAARTGADAYVRYYAADGVWEEGLGGGRGYAMVGGAAGVAAAGGKGVGGSPGGSPGGGRRFSPPAALRPGLARPVEFAGRASLALASAAAHAAPRRLGAHPSVPPSAAAAAAVATPSTTTGASRGHAPLPCRSSILPPSPPDWTTWAATMMRAPPGGAPPPSPSSFLPSPAVPLWRSPDGVTPYTTILSRLYRVLFAGGAAATTAGVPSTAAAAAAAAAVAGPAAGPAADRDAAVLAAAVGARFGLDRLGRLRAAAAAPVRDALWRAAAAAPSGGVPAAHVLLRREDLALNAAAALAGEGSAGGGMSVVFGGAEEVDGGGGPGGGGGGGAWDGAGLDGGSGGGGGGGGGWGAGGHAAALRRLQASALSATSGGGGAGWGGGGGVLGGGGGVKGWDADSSSSDTADDSGRDVVGHVDSAGDEEEGGVNGDAGSGGLAAGGGGGGGGLRGFASGGTRPRRRPRPPPDGCEMADRVYGLRFGGDLRLAEVRRLLRSSRPLWLADPAAAPPPLPFTRTAAAAAAVAEAAAAAATEVEAGVREAEAAALAAVGVVVTRRESTGESARAAALQAALGRSVTAILAAPVGRGAFTLRTHTPPDAIRRLRVPPLALHGRLRRRHPAPPLVIAPEPDTWGYATDWGDFHNGVATGLRLRSPPSASGGGGGSGGGPRRRRPLLDRTWIVANRVGGAAGWAAHGGLLLALGLGGHLDALRVTDWYAYLLPRHELTSIGLMTGVAAGRAGSGHATAARMLTLHLRGSNPVGFAAPDWHLSIAVQAAAALGVGLLYRGTAHRLMVEALTVELLRRPPPDDALDDRESLALAAGAGLGLLCLATGGAAAGLSDLGLTDRLVAAATGGRDPRYERRRARATAATATADAVAASGIQPPSEAAAVLSAAAAAHGVWGDEERATAGGAGFGLEGLAGGGGGYGLAPPPGAPPGTAGGGAGGTARVVETDAIDTPVTGPGATVALGLIYLRTGDAAVAAKLPLPATLWALDRVRADHLAVRVLARSLILWDDVQPTSAWLTSHWVGVLAPPPPGDPDAPVSRPRGFSASTRGSCPPYDLLTMAGAGVLNVDADGVRAARVYALAGACLALAIRLAGSSHPGAIAAITGAAEALEAVLIHPAHGAANIAAATAEATAVAGLALGIVAAGSGDIGVLRTLRRLRKRRPSRGTFAVRTYGHHMAGSMAVGLLTLGGCCQTLGTSNEAVAALVLAAYPSLPTAPDDNRVHLQAWRHLYVLAAVPRCVEAVDVDTGRAVAVPLAVGVRSRALRGVGAEGNPVANDGTGGSDDGTLVISTPLTAPCLLPEPAAVASVGVASPRYWPATIAGAPLRRWLAAAGAGATGTCGRIGGDWAAPQPHPRRLVLYVKRRAGHLPHAADPAGVRGVLARSVGVMRTAVAAVGAAHPSRPRLDDDADADPGVDGGIAAAAAALSAPFAADARVAAFVRVWGVPARLAPLVAPPPSMAVAAATAAVAAADTHVALAYEALSGDRPEALFAAVELLGAATRLRPPLPPPSPLRLLPQPRLTADDAATACPAAAAAASAAVTAAAAGVTPTVAAGAAAEAASSIAAAAASGGSAHAAAALAGVVGVAGGGAAA